MNEDEIPQKAKDFEVFKLKTEKGLAKEILKKLELANSPETYIPISIPLNYSKNLREVAGEIVDLKGLFIYNLASKRLIKDCFSEHKSGSVVHTLDLNFIADVEPLKKYLKDYIKSHLDPDDMVVIIYEDDYGFYVDGNRGKYYSATQGGKASKSYTLITTLIGKNRLLASDLQKATKYARVNKINPEILRINSQFRKRGVVIFDLIEKLPDGGYALNKKIEIRHLNNKNP